MKKEEVVVKEGYVLFRFVKDVDGNETNEKVYKCSYSGIYCCDLFHSNIQIYTCSIDQLRLVGSLDGYPQKVKITQTITREIEFLKFD